MLCGTLRFISEPLRENKTNFLSALEKGMTENRSTGFYRSFRCFTFELGILAIAIFLQILFYPG
jgi:hypothetical protein